LWARVGLKIFPDLDGVFLLLSSALSPAQAKTKQNKTKNSGTQKTTREKNKET
jgi:hypothetical protein